MDMNYRVSVRGFLLHERVGILESGELKEGRNKEASWK
jgi:hypothetical protein